MLTVYRWMYTGALNVGSQSKNDKLDNYIGFLLVAEELKILGPFDSVIASVRALLLSRTKLESNHIILVAKLPHGHPLRLLLAEACVMAYVKSLQLGPDGINGRRSHRRLRFRFQQELDTLDSFASDIQRLFQKIMAAKSTPIVDPFTKVNFDPYEHGFDPYAQR